MKAGSVDRLLGSLMIAAAAWAGGAFAAEKPAPWRITTNDTFLVVFDGRAPLMQYRHDASPRKPYIKELFTPGGVQVLRDAPADHLHHHGVMFAVNADGVEFWGEAPGSGRQKPGSPPQMRVVQGGGAEGPRAMFAQDLAWMGPASDQAVLDEARTIEVAKCAEGPATLVTWRTKLEPGPGRASVALSGRHYFGLGLRMLQTMDRDGKFLNSAGAEGEIVRNQEKNFRAKWSAYTAAPGKEPVTVAMFDHPNNPRHPAVMFTMPEPFAYLGVTLNLEKEPMALAAGEKLDLVYGVALWDGEVSADKIEAIYRRWVAGSGQ